MVRCWFGSSYRWSCRWHMSSWRMIVAVAAMVALPRITMIRGFVASRSSSPTTKIFSNYDDAANRGVAGAAAAGVAGAAARCHHHHHGRFPAILLQSALQHTPPQPSPSDNNSNSMNDDDDGKSADAPMDDEYEDDDDETVIRRRTLQWVGRVVIGLNLCPFAEKPYREKNGLRVVTVRGGDKDDSRGELLRAVRAEMERLVLSVDPNKAGTTLVVCPDCYPADFERYLDVVADVEDLILAGSSSDSSNDDSFEGILQVAPFHPLFQFAGSTSADAPDNATNRAPYPTFHLLREADVTAAVQRLVPPGNAAAVWSRNVDLLQALSGALSESDFRAIVTGADSNSSNNSTSNTTSPTLRFTVRQMLRRFRIPMLRGSSNSSDDADEDSTNAKNETDGM